MHSQTTLEARYSREVHRKGYLVVKRAFDIIAAGLLLVVGVPIILMACFAVWLEDPQLVIVLQQQRVGQFGRLFLCYKIRTMGCESVRTVESLEDIIRKPPNDGRITKVGRFLRTYSIDELPQLINVLNGSMSLVGPRPFVPEEQNLIPDPYQQRLLMRPGLTGLSQVSGRSTLPFEEAMSLDLEYIQQASLKMDFAILLRTVSAVLLGRGAL